MRRIILDTETTGLQTGYNEIIQIALIDGNGGAPLQNAALVAEADKTVRAAQKQAELQKQQFNKLNGKSANADEFLSENVKQARKGVSGTILTSPTGVAGQTLGGTTLLGG